MVAVPANVSAIFEMQDNRGFRSTHRLNFFEADISVEATTLGQAESLLTSLAGAWAAMSNCKLVKIGFAFDYDYAQEPSSETGTYQLVSQQAKLQGADGRGGFQSISVPGPKDGLFLTSADNNLIVVNPASSLLTAFQAAIASFGGSAFTSPRGGVPFSQFFGGQLKQFRPPIRRVLQGQ